MKALSSKGVMQRGGRRKCRGQCMVGLKVVLQLRGRACCSAVGEVGAPGSLASRAARRASFSSFLRAFRTCGDTQRTHPQHTYNTDCSTAQSADCRFWQLLLFARLPDLQQHVKHCQEHCAEAPRHADCRA